MPNFGYQVLGMGAHQQGAAFSPTDISGLALWLDASDISTLYQDAAKTTPVASDGDPVGAWVDLSGNGNDHTQTTASSKPTYKTSIINSTDILRFDGGDYVTGGDILDSIYAGVDSTFTVVIVFKSSGGAGVEGLVCKHGFTGNRGSYVHTYLNKFRANFYMNAVAEDFRGAIGDTTLGTTARIGICTYDGSVDTNDGDDRTKLRIDGADETQTPVSSGTLGDIVENAATHNVGYVFDTLFYTGDIAEIMLYDSVLTAGDIASIESYLSNKWGITI